MTEYDFSPEAIDAYIQKQAKISNWVDNRVTSNPFTPDPAVRAHRVIDRVDEDDRREKVQRWLEDERQHTRRVADLRTAQQIQLIVEEDMLQKTRPRPVDGQRPLDVTLSGQTTGSHDPSRSSSVTLWARSRSTVHSNGSQERQTQALPETGSQVNKVTAPTSHDRRCLIM